MMPNLLAAKAGIFFRTGDRVELSPSTDAWMRGARFGEIVGIIRGRKHGVRARIKLDRAGVVVLPASLFTIL